jgi:hypothetical protein
MSVHYDYPLRLGRDGSLVTVPQDSHADIVAAVIGVMSYRRTQIGPNGEALPGHRLDRPGLGIDDPTFRQGGTDLEELREVLAEQEPRADALFDNDPQLLVDLIDVVTITPEG